LKLQDKVAGGILLLATHKMVIIWLARRENSLAGSRDSTGMTEGWGEER